MFTWSGKKAYTLWVLALALSVMVLSCDSAARRGGGSHHGGQSDQHGEHDHESHTH